MQPNAVFATIASVRLLPVIVVQDANDTPPLAAALKAGGLKCAEITLRSAAAADAIRAIADDPDMIVGAGTVLRASQLEEAVRAGARFIVTPGFSREVVQLAQEAAVPVFPGVATATEVQMALDEGVDVLKFFPAEAMGGVATLKALGGPFPMVRFIPTGGINLERLKSYLDVKSVLAVGGSWMVAPELLRDKRFDEVSRLAAEAATLVRALTGPSATPAGSPAMTARP